MRRAVVVVCLLGGCNTEGRVDVVVSSPEQDVDTVALFVGDGDGTPDTIVHPDAKLGAASVWWPRDPGNEDDVVSFSGGEVTFTYKPGALDHLSALVAVGLKGGKPVAAAWHDAIAIPDGELARYPIELLPLGNTVNLALWHPAAPNPDPASVTCVSYENADDAPAKLIVTDGDPDCDGYPTGDPLECVNKVYMGQRTARLDEIDCAMPRMITTPGGTGTICELGGPRCADGMGEQPGCFPTRYCVARSDCEMCGNDFTCLTDVATHAQPTGMYLRCDVATDANGQMCPQPIQAFPATKPPYVSGRMCVGDAQISNGKNGFNQDVQFETAKFRLDGLDASCNFQIFPEGQFGMTDSLAALGVATLDNGRGVALPIVFARGPISTDGCPLDAAPCTLLNGLSTDLIDCINAPLP